MKINEYMLQNNISEKRFSHTIEQAIDCLYLSKSKETPLGFEIKLNNIHQQFKKLTQDVQELVTAYQERTIDSAIENLSDRLNKQEHIINEFIDHVSN